MNKVIVPVVCPVCGDAFTPRPRADRKPSEACPGCARRWEGRKRRGIVPTQLVEAKRRKADERAQQALEDAFGALTDREVAIYESGQRRGYDRGYQKGYQALPDGMIATEKA